MTVLYRSPEYLKVKVYNENKYQSSRSNEFEKDKTNNFNRGLGPYVTKKNFLPLPDIYIRTDV